jgi:hypothetical protein
MKEGQFNDDRHDAEWDKSDPLWRLLGESPRPEPEPWFAARTLAHCRAAGRGVQFGVESFVQAWRWAVGTGLGVTLAVVLVLTQIHAGSVVPEKQKKVQEAFEIMASLNSSDSDSSTSSSSSSWQDQDSSSL